jgi:hypothetical protein
MGKPPPRLRSLPYNLLLDQEDDDDTVSWQDISNIAKALALVTLFTAAVWVGATLVK